MIEWENASLMNKMIIDQVIESERQGLGRQQRNLGY